MIAHDSLQMSVSAADRRCTNGGTCGAPKDEIAVGVVDERGDAPVRVDPLNKPALVLLAVAEVHVDGVEGEPELL